MIFSLFKSKLFMFFIVASSIVTIGCSKKMDNLNTDKSMKKAPNFTLPDETGKMHSLADYAGKKLVLYFYPKDESPTCTKQACSIRNDFKIYQDHGIVILGISADSVESHKKFKEHHHLPFPLLADIDGKVAKVYGAQGGLLGFMGYAQRKTYLINEQGHIIKVIDDVNVVATQAQDILAGFGLNSK